MKEPRDAEDTFLLGKLRMVSVLSSLSGEYERRYGVSLKERFKGLWGGRDKTYAMVAQR